jgi:hypothetical protein
MMPRIAAAVLLLTAIGGVTTVASGLLTRGLPGTSAADSPAQGEDAGVVSAPSEVPPMAGAPEATVDELAGTLLLATGTDYRHDTLSQLAADPLPLPLRTFDTRDTEFRAEAELSDLTTVDRLQACLAEVGLIHPGPVVTVDFARFEGEPAAILVVRQSDSSTVVAVGSDCGAAGADILASVEVP